MNSVSRKYVLRSEVVFGKCASEPVPWILAVRRYRVTLIP